MNGKIDPNSLVQRLAKYILSKGRAVRSQELAEAFGVPSSRVTSGLAPMVQNGTLTSCTVELPNGRRQVEYREGPGRQAIATRPALKAQAHPRLAEQKPIDQPKPKGTTKSKTSPIYPASPLARAQLANVPMGAISETHEGVLYIPIGDNWLILDAATTERLRAHFALSA